MDYIIDNFGDLVRAYILSKDGIPDDSNFQCEQDDKKLSITKWEYPFEKPEIISLANIDEVQLNNCREKLKKVEKPLNRSVYFEDIKIKTEPVPFEVRKYFHKEIESHKMYPLIMAIAKFKGIDYELMLHLFNKEYKPAPAGWIF